MPIAHASALSVWRVSVRRYDQLTKLGWFDDQRVELLNGRIIRMAPQAEPHSVAILLAERTLRAALARGRCIRTQMPLQLGKHSKPEPDLAVVAGDVRDSITSGAPTAAALVMEVSDTTLRKDRGIKASLYARFGIADYWIVNLVDRHVEVHRNPIRDAAHRYRFRYAQIEVKGVADSMFPLAMPQAAVKVVDLLP
jgi:Uma2 family endonuclease